MPTLYVTINEAGASAIGATHSHEVEVASIQEAMEYVNKRDGFVTFAQYTDDEGFASWTPEEPTWLSAGWEGELPSWLVDQL